MMLMEMSMMMINSSKPHKNHEFNTNVETDVFSQTLFLSDIIFLCPLIGCKTRRYTPEIVTFVIDEGGGTGKWKIMVVTNPMT